MKIWIAPLIVITCILCGACRSSPEVRKQRALANAKRYMAAKDYNRAVLEFRNAAQADPRDAEVLYQLGVAYLDNQDVRSAVQSFQRAVQIDPKHSGAQIKLAEVYSGVQDQESIRDAAARMESLLSANPENPDALSTLGSVELRLGQFDSAEKHLTEAIDRAPTNLKAAIGLAQLRIKANKYAEAEAVLKKATGQQPPLATPHIILGEFYVRLNRLDEARGQFTQALNIDKDNALALLDLGNLQFRTGALADADNTFKRLSSGQDEKYKTVHAVFLFQTGQRERGIEEMRNLYDANPKDREVRRQLVAAYTIGGKAAEANALLTNALKKNPRDTDALLHRARVELGNRKYVDAQNSLNQVLKYEPNSGQAHYLLAAVHGRMGNQMNRRQALADAVRSDREFLPARLELARLLTNSRAASSALTLLNETPDWQQDRIEVITERNRALIATADREGAKKGIQAGLAIGRTAELLIQDAVIKMNQREFGPARLVLEEILKNFPEETRALDLLAGIAEQENHRSLAINRTREHVAAHPKSAKLQLYLGNRLIESGALPEARAAFEAARNIDPSFWPANVSLARVSMRQNRIDEAKALLSPLADHTDAGVTARHLLAEIDIRNGNGAAAIGHFRKIAESAPNDVIAMNNLAYALVEYGNLPDEALRIAQRAKELAPNNPAIDDTLGWVLYKKGLYNNALRYLEDSVKKQPSAQRHAHLAIAYGRKGDSERGFEHLSAAMKLDSRIPEIAEAQKLLGTGGR